jgi:uncharacterized zinc-type alcohol dehydrogenase-like protein
VEALAAAMFICSSTLLRRLRVGGIAETQEMVFFCADHGVICDIELISIDKINEACERVLKGDVKYRFVST